MNSGPRTLSMIIGILGALMAAFLIIEGLHLIILGGSWFYTLAGIALAASSVYMIRRNILSTWIALGLLVATALWSLAEVGTSFWPSFSRLIVFLCVALIATLMAPWLSGPGRRYFTRPVTGATSGALGAIIVAFLAGMFRVHPTIAPQDTTHPQETASTADSDQPGHDWPAYGRTASGTRYASFTQINRDNVSKLRVAWTYRTGDMALNGAEFQGTPIKIGDTVYICSPHNIVSALDPDTGTEKWKFDPHAQTKVWQRCRG
ncbi:MAG: membrane-bound PQQ-dependent dehydrogenase, glucose/quinate/shikimate family, partial [Gluconobacter oxydans]